MAKLLRNPMKLWGVRRPYTPGEFQQLKPKVLAKVLKRKKTKFTKKTPRTKQTLGALKSAGVDWESEKPTKRLRRKNK